MFDTKLEVCSLLSEMLCHLNNYSYVSEAAASLLDDRLNLNIVPKTQLVALSSPVGHVFKPASVY